MGEETLRFIYISAVLEARNKQNLGDLNPIMFPAITMNCIGWTMYGVMRNDYYIYLANSPGIPLGLFFSISSLQLLTLNVAKEDRKSRSVRTLIELILVLGVSFWLLLALISGLVVSSHKVIADRIVGIASCIFAIAFYAAPLSTMVEVIKTRDASRLGELFTFIYHYIYDHRFTLTSFIVCIYPQLQRISSMPRCGLSTG